MSNSKSNGNNPQGKKNSLIQRKDGEIVFKMPTIQFRLPIAVSHEAQKGNNNNQQQNQGGQNNNNPPKGNNQPKVTADQAMQALFVAFMTRMTTNRGYCLAVPIIIRENGTAYGRIEHKSPEAAMALVMSDAAKFLRSFEWVVSIYEQDVDGYMRRVLYAEPYQVQQGNSLAYEYIGSADMVWMVKNVQAEQTRGGEGIYRAPQDEVKLPKKQQTPQNQPLPPQWDDGAGYWSDPQP